MDFKELVARRRSHRKYSEEPVAEADLKKILRAALMSPSSKCRRDWQFIVVQDKEVIKQLAASKSAGSQFLEGTPLAIVVTGNEDTNDCWIEDASIAAITMQYQAEELGLGSCWIEIRGRATEAGQDAEDYIRQLMSLPQQMRVLCVVAIGHATDERRMQNEDKLKWENVHMVPSSEK